MRYIDGLAQNVGRISGDTRLLSVIRDIQVCLQPTYDSAQHMAALPLCMLPLMEYTKFSKFIAGESKAGTACSS